jgi:hypothetical protein
MEYIITLSLLGVGYFVNKNNKIEREIDKKNIKNNSNLKVNNIYDSGLSSQVKKQQQKTLNTRYIQSKYPKKTKIIPPNYNLDYENLSNNNIRNDNILIDNKIRKNIEEENKIKYLERPSDTRKTNQRHNDNSLINDDIISPLTGVPMSKEDFSHNNMIPFFGGSIKQNVEEFSNNSLLYHQNGSNNYFISKKEQEPLFNPKNNMNYINGTPNMDTNILERFIPSQMRTNESPVDKVYVGPGLDKGFTATPTGGFNQSNTRDYIIPKSTNELRTLNNPKLSYNGVIIPGKGIDKRTTIGDVKKNNPDRYYINSPARYNVTTGAYVKEKKRPTHILKNTSRPDMHNSYSGSAGPVGQKEIYYKSKYKYSDKISYKPSSERNLNLKGNWNEKDADYGKKNTIINANERDITQKRTHISNVSSIVKSIIAPLQDIIKTTKKENFIGNNRQAGNFSSSVPKKQTIYDPNDVVRTTIKETNIHDNRNGNLKGPIKVLVYDPNDIIRKTIKETNIHDNRTGNMNSNRQQQPAYDPNDITRTTIKETNIHDNRTGNMNSNRQQQPAYDPNDITRTTIKETNIHDNRTGNINSSQLRKTTAYDPNDITRTTIKETNIHDNRTGNINSSQLRKTTAYDPNDITRTTIKETNIHDNRTGNINSSQLRKTTAYDPNDITRTTIKETNIHDNRTGNINSSQLRKTTAYDPNDITRTTIKETNIHDNRTGNINSSQLRKTTAYDPNDITRTTIKETNIHDNRTGNINSSQLRKTTAYDPNDITRTTIKETNIHDNRTGNINSSQLRKTTAYDPNDITRTTIKETNIHDNRTGNINSSQLKKTPAYDPNDITRTTIKETNIHDNRTGNMNSSQLKKTPAYDPNDITRTTIKETNIHDNRTGNMNSSQLKKTPAYDPNDITKTTIKETNIHDNRLGNTGPMYSNSGGGAKIVVKSRDNDNNAKITTRQTLENQETTMNLNSQGPKKSIVYDPNNVAKTTIKETNIHDNRAGNINGIEGTNYGYLTNEIQVPNTNKQFTSEKDYTGQADGNTMNGGGDGYQTNEFNAPNTNKQFISDNEYTGDAHGSDKPISYNDAYSSTYSGNKEEVSHGRNPTKTNAKISVGEDQINMKTDKIEEDIINRRDLTSTKVYNSIVEMDKCQLTTEKQQISNEINETRIEPSILEAFKNNPYTQPLDSHAFN